MSESMRASNPGRGASPSSLALILFLAILSLLAISCQGVRSSSPSNNTGGNPQPTPQPSGPPTITFTAQPTAIILGASTTLSWSSTNATSVTIDNGIGQVAASGTKDEIPPTTTTYNATAAGPGGSAKASVTVTVGGLQGFQLSAKPTSILQGQSSTLTFSAPGADFITIDNGVGKVGASGSVTVTPTSTTTYTGTASFNGATMNASVTITVAPLAPMPTVSLSVNPTAITPGQSATLSWTSTNTTSLSINQGVGPVAIPSGSVSVSPSATTVYTITANDGPPGTTPQTAKASVTLNVNAPVPVLGGVFTYKYDNGRTGQNLSESVLTPVNVNQVNFGKVFSFNVDGMVYGEPLYVPGVTISGATHNVVYVVTEHDSVYAFDADNKSSAPLWHVSFLNGVGVTTVPTADVGSTIFPEIGITSTPVIDPATGTIYVEAFTKENGSYFQRLHALDITSGTEKFGGPVTISGSVKGSGVGNDGAGNVPFQAKIELQRAGLLLLNNTVYIGFASHGDNGPYHGWVVGYNASTLTQVGLWNDTPNGQDGGIWQGGGGLAADSAGAIYGVSGNGTADGGPDYGDSFFKLTQSGNTLSVADFFTPSNQQTLSNGDVDVGSGGPMLLPDQPGGHPHLMTQAGKEGKIYLVDRDSMGGYNTAHDNVVQEIPNAVGVPPAPGRTDRNFSTPSFWQSRVYYVGASDSAKAFVLSNGMLTPSPQSQSISTFGIPGATPVVSANGNTNGILWAIDRAGLLRAFDATNLATELYNSSQAGTRDTLGTTIRFSVPTVANGRVYVGTKGQLVVYGLLH